MTPKELRTIFRGFLLRYSGLPEDLVFRGNQSRTAMPSGETFLVFTEIMKVPVSVGTEFFDVALGEKPEEDVGTWTVSPLHHITFQVDAWGDDGCQVLDRLKVLFKSGVGAEYFAKLRKGPLDGVGVVSARAWMGTTTTDGTPEYATRATCDFVLSARLTESVDQDWAEHLDIRLNGEQ